MELLPNVLQQLTPEKNAVVLGLMRPRFWHDVLNLSLEFEKWKNVDTTDDLNSSYGQLCVCYTRSNKTDRDKLKFVKINEIAPGFVVCFGDVPIRLGFQLH